MTLSLVPFSRRVQDRSTCTTSELTDDSPTVSSLTSAAAASNASLVDSSATKAIAARGIQMTYQNGSQSQTVLHDIDLSIQPGTVQLLMGRLVLEKRRFCLS